MEHLFSCYIHFNKITYMFGIIIYTNEVRTIYE